jgi:hypothetical protein
MILFFVGVIEMMIMTAWTKTVSDTKIWASGAITMFSIIIWYYVLETIVHNITNWMLVILYALGCSLGTILSTVYFQRREKKRNALAAGN